MTLKELAHAILATPEQTQNSPALVVIGTSGTHPEKHIVTAFAHSEIVAEKQ